MKRVTPMLHVPDLRATVDWYAAIGFTVVATHDDDGELHWAELSLGEGRIMLNRGGTAKKERRDVDLYVHVSDLDELHASIASRVEVVEPLHQTFYGMREFIVRDPNGFWVTFAERVAEGPAAG